MKMKKHIAIYSEKLPLNFRWVPHNFVGGTTEFVVEIATELAKDYEVSVYYDGYATEFSGVSYIPRELYRPTDYVLACNSIPPSLGNKNFYWSSKNTDKQDDFLDFDQRFVLSQYHQSLFGTNSVILPLACHTDRFMGGKKDPTLCIFTSSPDRGRDFLESIWPKVAKETGAKLVCTYSASISEAEMTELYKEASYWLHPMVGGAVELFCISGYKAQAAGCWPVYVPEQALAETVLYGTNTTKETFADDLITAIKEQPEPKIIGLPNWSDITDALRTYF